ncbi:NAD(P)-dependent oxidoreductase [Cellulomonas sp. PhB150]|uniref:NAD(P)-dependent oxidoreductase n=1 Tax=Cellulomonas sp. PhB150 TaxID=2485188 RepID=UPI000FAAFDDF|nr:NAD(P)-dependent oxidoreductase [Cellulomonas sp. PhB150]ROS31139.1 phosphoglycerate dehydrogenase-like enzyme [Cellulomonas sp. PhB150]
MASYRGVTTILVPTTLHDHVTLPAGVQAVRYAPDEPVPDSDAEVLVVWGSGRRVLRDAATRLPRLRWVAGLAAGVDTILEAGFAPEVVVTSGRGLHDGPVAEHTLALVLACARRVPELVRAQDEHRWVAELGGIQEIRADEFRSLAGARVVVWGFGSIAGRLAPLLTALGASVTGVATSSGVRGGYHVVTPDELLGVLPATDLLVSLLPDTPGTRHAIDAEVLAFLPPHAWVVNVGRGATLDQDALLAAVRTGALAGAALDVFEREPLPADSPIWDEPRILVSPHGAGGRPIGAGALLSENLAAYLAGRPLRNTVDR